MDFFNIPFTDFGVDDGRGNTILKGILNKLRIAPDNSLDIQQIADSTESTGYDVKKVFYYLLYQGFLTATYIPYHKRCGCPVGRMVDSVNDILISDYIDFLCAHCPEPISEPEEIEIRLVFWGAKE